MLLCNILRFFKIKVQYASLNNKLIRASVLNASLNKLIHAPVLKAYLGLWICLLKTQNINTVINSLENQVDNL